MSLVLVDIYNFYQHLKANEGLAKPDFLDNKTELPPKDHFKNIHTADSWNIIKFLICNKVIKKLLVCAVQNRQI